MTAPLSPEIQAALVLARKALIEVEWWGHIGYLICPACNAREPSDHRRPMRHKPDCQVHAALTAIEGLLTP